jgi:hypothetical protein
MEDNEEEECDDNFPTQTGFGAFDDDTAMEEPEGEEADDDPTDDLGRRCTMREKIVKVKRRG